MKKGFTLIELLLVVLIIGLLGSTLVNMFSFKNVYKFKYDACYIRTISNIDTFFQQALLQKQVFTGGVHGAYTGASYYQIIFNVDKQYVAFVYGGIGTGKVIQFYGTGIDNINQCFYAPYYTKISGDNLKVVIQGGLSLGTNQGKQAMSIYTGNSTLPGSVGSTGEIIFYFCEGVGNCWEKNKIVIDTKTYLFRKYFCKKSDLDTKECLVWSE